MPPCGSSLPTLTEMQCLIFHRTLFSFGGLLLKVYSFKYVNVRSYFLLNVEKITTSFAYVFSNEINIYLLFSEMRQTRLPVRHAFI